jgi:hypothetical protein
MDAYTVTLAIQRAMEANAEDFPEANAARANLLLNIVAELSLEMQPHDAALLSQAILPEG